jgi:hypothetical protein
MKQVIGTRVMSELVIVISYSGHRGEELPRAFFLESGRIEVASVLKSWVEERANTRTRFRCFLVEETNGMRHLLSYDEELDMWFHGHGAA